MSITRFVFTAALIASRYSDIWSFTIAKETFFWINSFFYNWLFHKGVGVTADNYIDSAIGGKLFGKLSAVVLSVINMDKAAHGYHDLG